MSCSFEDVEGDMPWSVLLRVLVESLLQELNGGVGRSLFIGWDDEASLDEALSDFVVEGESDKGC